MVNSEWAGLLRVPRPDPFVLTTAPLAQVVAQVRYPVIAHLQLLPGVAQLQDRLKPMFPFMEQKQQHGINLSFNSAGIGPAVQQTATTSWEFTSDEHPYVLTVESGSSSLSVDGRAYEGFERLHAMFETLTAALEEVEDVRRCDRLGVRFLNVHPAAGGYDQVLRLFRTELVGLLAVVPTTTSVPGSISQLQLSSNKVLPDNSEVQGTIYSGLLPAGSTLPGLPPITLEERSFFMDSDVFSAQGRKFRRDSLSEAFQCLHTELDAIFHYGLTDEGREHFGLRSSQ